MHRDGLGLWSATTSRSGVMLLPSAHCGQRHRHAHKSLYAGLINERSIFIQSYKPVANLVSPSTHLEHETLCLKLTTEKPSATSPQKSPMPEFLKKSNASDTPSAHCKSSCAWLGLIATAQGYDDLPAPVCREMSALESLCADTEAKKRDAKPAPIDMHTFFGAGAMLFKKLVDD